MGTAYSDVYARLSRLEFALCRIAYLHQERDAPSGMALLGRAQDIARQAIEHIPWRDAQEMAEHHHEASRAIEAANSTVK